PGAEVLPPCQGYELSAEADFDALAVGATAEHREAKRVRRRREQLVVLAEAEVLDGHARDQRDVLEVELDPAARAGGEVAGVHRQPVGDIRQRVSDGAQPATFFEPERRPGLAALAEGSACAAERTGHDDGVARPRARAARNP